MGLLQTAKNFLYELLTRSHILYYTLPLYGYFLIRFVINPQKNYNHVILDRKGNKVPTCKVNGRYYPSFGEWRVRTFSGITIRDTDVLLCGFPKTGCHWTHEILSMLITGKSKLSKYGKGFEGMMDILPDCILDSLISPRVLNTHYLYEELPVQVKEKKTKIVFTVRNPKDTAVSAFNHMKNIPYHGYEGDFDDFFEMFVSGEMWYGSYFDFLLSWDKHIRDPNANDILVVKFEDLKANTIGEIKRIAKFLGVSVTDEFAEEIRHVSSFQNMKAKRNGIGKEIFRKGAVGDWKNWLTDEQSLAIDKVWQQKLMGCSYQPQY